MGVALTVTMVGMPVGTAVAKSSSNAGSTTKGKVAKKAIKKSKKKVSKKKSAKKVSKTTKKTKTLTALSTSMQSASDELGYLLVRPSEGVQMDGPVLGAEAAKIAKKYVGYSYVYGGASPSTGFDCSGFTQYVYKKAGVSIWRTAQDQYNFCKKLKNKVKKSDIVPGDLLFFGSSTGSISHVGIYIGKGKFVHASTPSTGVKITKLSQRTNWVAAGRPYQDD